LPSAVPKLPLRDRASHLRASLTSGLFSSLIPAQPTRTCASSLPCLDLRDFEAAAWCQTHRAVLVVGVFRSPLVKAPDCAELPLSVDVRPISSREIFRELLFLSVILHTGLEWFLWFRVVLTFSCNPQKVVLAVFCGFGHSTCISIWLSEARVKQGCRRNPGHVD
jgi:hypothetical protein